MKSRYARTLLRAAALLAVGIACGNNPAHAQTTVYSFTGANGDGEYPFPEGHMPFDQ